MTGSAFTLDLMPAKPNPLLGLVVGAVAAWIGTTAITYAVGKLNVIRAIRFDNSVSESLPWVLLVVVVSALLGLLLSIRTIAAGAQVGAGALLTVVGIAVQLVPLRTAFNLSKAFEVPGSRPGGYLLWNGAVLFVGVLLLVLGVRRWSADSRRTPPGAQDYLPGQQYRGQQYPGAQYPGPQVQGQSAPWQNHPGQGQPYPGQTHPGQQQPGQTFPGR